MIDDALVLRVERLRDDVETFRDELRERYRTTQSQVVARTLRDSAAQLGERWLVEVAQRLDVAAVLGPDTTSSLSIEFQRLITLSERGSRRSLYDSSLRSILRDFRTTVILPLKQARYQAIAVQPPGGHSPAPVAHRRPIAFLAQSFSSADRPVADLVQRLLVSAGCDVVTGERPKADTISSKVRERIDSADIFLGLFTRRDRIHGQQQWTTSAWVIDEKAFALARGKKLVLIKEAGVQSIGGLQGDYEYLEFTRARMPDLLLRLLDTVRPLTAA